MIFDDLKKLHQKKYRKEFQHVLVEGEHLVQELEKSNFQNCLIYSTEEYFSISSRFRRKELSEKQCKQLSEVKTPQGIFGLIPLVEFEKMSSLKRVIYLDEVQDPGNLGTILRSAAWFGNTEIWLSEGSVDPFNAKVIRSSMGAIFHVPIKLNVSHKKLISSFDRLACLDLNGELLQEKSFIENECFVFGNEGRGLSKELKSSEKIRAYTIQGNTNIESLNLASSVTIALYELNR